MSDLHLQLTLGAGIALVELPVLLALVGLSRLFGRAARRLDLAIAFLLPFLVLAPYLLTSRLFVPTAAYADLVPGAARAAAPDAFDHGLNDAVLQFLPWELEVRHALAARHLPFWSDTLDGGSELWGNLQAQVLSPIALAARLFPVQFHLLAAFALKLLVAFLGATLLARAHGLRPEWARIAGLTFALGGALAPWAVFPHSAAAPWAPWVALGALRLARHPRGRAGRHAVVGTALATAALLLGGHPEVALAGVLFAGLLAFALGRSGWSRRGRGAAAVAAAGLLGALLAAPVLIPFAHLVDRSQRAHEKRQVESPTGEGLAGKPSFLLAPLHPAPNAGGGEGSPNPLAGARPAWSYFATGYAGLAALLGLALLLVRPAPRRFAPALAFFLFTLLAVADLHALARLWRALPLLSLAETTRFQPVGLLALAVAGAGGLQTLTRRRGALRRALASGAAATASLLCGAVAAVLLPWTLFAASVRVATRRPRVAATLVTIGALLDLGTFAWRQLPRGESAHFLPPTRFMSRLATELAAPGGPWRATGQEFLVFPSLLPAYGLAEPRPHNPLVPQRQVEALDAAFGFHPSTRDYFSPLGRLVHPLLDFLGVRAVVTNAYLPPLAGMPRIDEGEAAPQPFRLVRNLEALPRAFLPQKIDRVTDEGLVAWIDQLDDPRRVAVASTNLADLAPATGDLRVSSTSPGRMHFELAPQAATTLVAISLPGPAGWQARASGLGPLRTIAVNGAWLGVVVPPAARAFDLVYRPPGLVAGLTLAIAAALLLLFLALPSRSPWHDQR